MKKILSLAILSAIILTSMISTEALNKTSDYYVSPYGTWNIFILGSKSKTGNRQTIQNDYGYGETGYCYFKTYAGISSGTERVLVWGSEEGIKVYKNSKSYNYQFYNTVDAGKRMVCRVTGTSGQTAVDKAHIYWNVN